MAVPDVTARPAQQPTLPPTGDVDPFFRELLVAMAEFRDGNFAVRMPSDVVGTPGRIADAFNDILTISQRRATEISRVCRVVGKEGRLRERMVVPNAMGVRADESRVFMNFGPSFSSVSTLAHELGRASCRERV